MAEIQGATDVAVGTNGTIVDTIATIRQLTGWIAEAVQQQGAATSEIAASTLRAADGAQEINSNISGVG